MIEVSSWQHCYPSRWVGIITPESMRHPAKFSSRLIARIYRHCLEEGWLKPGDQVIDPFGGVALGALEAMRCGLAWTGCEIEEHFVELGSGNIALWNSRYTGKLPVWGTARLLQGDSRNLAHVIQQADGIVSSPPYVDRSIAPGGIQGVDAGKLRINEGQTYNCAVTSPPYADGCSHTGGNTPTSAEHIQGGTLYGVGVNGVISSPPYASSLERPNGIDPDKIKKPGSANSQTVTDPRYGSTPGQLGAMPAGDYQAAISSPPFLQTQGGCNVTSTTGPLSDPALIRRHSAGNQASNAYGETPGQLSQESYQTFWGASRQIIDQVYQVLTPGGHAVWVVKAFVKSGQIVDFPGQWRAVCEAAGFETLHEHHAMLTHHRATYQTIEGEMVEDRVESKSFFRRLAEKKGSPRIDWETVLCMRKP